MNRIRGIVGSSAVAAGSTARAAGSAATTAGPTAGAAGDARPLRWPLLAALALINAVNPLSIDVFLAAFPTMARELHTTPATVQLTLTTYLIGMACGQFVIGPVSDSLGRRRPLVIGTLGCLAASVACALAPTIGLLVAARCVQGFAAAAGVVTARAVIADLTGDEQTARVMNLMMIIMAVAPIVGPVLGGVVFTALGWRAVLWSVALAVAVMAAGALLVVPESLPPSRRHGGGLVQLVSGMRAVVTDRVYLGYMLTAVLGFGTLFAYISSSSFVVQEVLGLGPRAFTLVFGANALATTLVSAMSMRLVGRVRTRRLLGVGVTWSVLGCLVLTLLVLVAGAPVVPVLVAFPLTLAALGLVMGNATALAISRVRANAGSGSAVLGTLQFTVAGAVSSAAGLGDGASGMAVVMLSCACLSALSFAVVTRERGLRQTATGGRSPVRGPAGRTGSPAPAGTPGHPGRPRPARSRPPRRSPGRRTTTPL